MARGAAARRAPLVRRRSVTMKDLASEDWISWSTGQICHDWLVHALHAHGAQPRIRHTASEHSTQIALVAAGLGAAAIPGSAANLHRRRSGTCPSIPRPSAASTHCGGHAQLLAPRSGPRSTRLSDPAQPGPDHLCHQLLGYSDRPPCSDHCCRAHHRHRRRTLNVATVGQSQIGWGGGLVV